MRRCVHALLPCLAILLLFGCADAPCMQTTGGFSPGEVVVVQGDGVNHTAVADENGNVSHGCGTTAAR
jgi:hypothetical protein